METPKEKLVKLLRENKVIPFVGAGVSMATAELPSWKDLILNGLEYGLERNLDIDNNVIKAKNLLQRGEYLDASEHLKKLLSAPKWPFNNWLNEVFDKVDVVSPLLIQSILDLCSPIIATTNYDNLLTNVSNLDIKEKFVHSEYDFACAAIKSGKEVILHLHGIYEKPESIILSTSDYEALNLNAGYKSFLQSLLMNYHFLFIGCSRDGVMDADFSVIFDFISRLFPVSGNQHFILLREQEINNQSHISLLNHGNIEAINFGKVYSDLPIFINSINPNLNKRQEQIRKYEKNLRIELKRISRLTNSFENPELLQEFIEENLTTDNGWIDSETLDVYGQILGEYNFSLETRKQQMKLTQSMLGALFSTKELREKVEKWKSHSSSPKDLDPINYIGTAIMAYECLQKIPKTIINDIKLSKLSVSIHEYFYTGYLQTFISGIKNRKELGYDLEEYYKNDNYLFENLKRIIDSLLGFLELNPNSIYSELMEATLVKELPEDFLIVITDKFITLRDNDNLNKIIANLPIEENFPVYKAFVVEFRKCKLIIGYNSKYCFYWSPQKHISAIRFTESYISAEIRDAFGKFDEEGKLIITVVTKKRLYYFEDFKFTDVKELPKHFYQLLPYETGFVAVNFTDSYSDKKPFLYFLDEELRLFPLTSAYGIEDLLFNDPLSRKLIGFTRLENEKELFASDQLSNFSLSHIIDYENKQNLLLRCYTTEKKMGLWVILTINENRINQAHFMPLKESTSIAVDYHIKGDTIVLISGYLDIHRKNAMFEILNISNFTIEKRRIVDKIRQDEHEIRDVLHIAYVPEKKVILNEDGRKLHSFCLNKEIFTTVEFPEDERINYLKYYKSN